MAKKYRWNKRKFAGNMLTLAVIAAFNVIVLWMLIEWVSA